MNRFIPRSALLPKVSAPTNSAFDRNKQSVHRPPQDPFSTVSLDRMEQRTSSSFSFEMIAEQTKCPPYYPLPADLSKRNSLIFMFQRSIVLVI